MLRKFFSLLQHKKIRKNSHLFLIYVRRIFDEEGRSVDCVIRKSGGQFLNRKEIAFLFVSAGKKFFYKKIKEGKERERNG